MTRRGDRRFKKAEVMAAMEGGKGIKTATAMRLGCSRTTLDKYIRENPDLEAKLIEEREKYKDVIESMAYTILSEEKNVAMCIFLLKTLCKDRGYVEKIENHIVSDKPQGITMQITKDENEY